MRLPAHWEPRIYRTAPGFWGLGLHHSAAHHWSVQVGPWVFTTEPGEAGADVMKEQAMRLLSAANRRVHRLMRGRCWNPRACLWLSEYEAEKEIREEKQE